MNAQRALLDSLMGASRNEDPDKKRKVSWYDSLVCPYKLVSFCPYKLFEETWVELGGTCSRDHGEYLRMAYEKEATPKEKRKYERKLLSFLKELIYEVDRAIRREEDRLGITKESKKGEDAEKENSEQTEVEQALSDPLLAFSKSQQEQLRHVERLIKEKEDRIDRLNLNNKKAEVEYLTPELDALMKEKIEIITRAKKQAEWVAPGCKRVCEICGITMDHGRTDYYDRKHFGGRIHQAYLQIREVAAELEKGLAGPEKDKVSRNTSEKKGSVDRNLIVGEVVSQEKSSVGTPKEMAETAKPLETQQKEGAPAKSLEGKRAVEHLAKTREFSKSRSKSASKHSPSSRGKRDEYSYDRHPRSSSQRRDEDRDKSRSRERPDDRQRQIDGHEKREKRRRAEDSNRSDDYKRKRVEYPSREHREDSRRRTQPCESSSQRVEDRRSRRSIPRDREDGRTPRRQEYRQKASEYSRDRRSRDNSRPRGRPDSRGLESSHNRSKVRSDSRGGDSSINRARRRPDSRERVTSRYNGSNREDSRRYEESKRKPYLRSRSKSRSRGSRVKEDTYYPRRSRSRPRSSRTREEPIRYKRSRSKSRDARTLDESTRSRRGTEYRQQVSGRRDEHHEYASEKTRRDYDTKIEDLPKKRYYDDGASRHDGYRNGQRDGRRDHSTGRRDDYRRRSRSRSRNGRERR